jgi:hypothetical protein
MRQPKSNFTWISCSDFFHGVKKHVFLLLLALTACSSAPLISTVNPTISPSNTNAETYSTSTFGLHDISTFDVYVDDNIIHIIVGGKVSAKDKHIKIRYLRSDDGGQHWDNSITLDDQFPTSINSRGNDIHLVAKSNHLLAVWQTKGELPGMGPMVSAYSEDNGKTWKFGGNPAVNNTGDQSHFDLIADQQGSFHAVWLEDPEENGYQSLRYANSANSGKTWAKSATLDNSTCSCCWNTFVLSPENKLNILYRDMKPRDMVLMQSPNFGQNWQQTSTVGEFNWQFDGCPHVGGGLAYAGKDQLHSLVWTGAEHKSGLYYLASKDNGVSWSSPKKMGNTAIHADIAALDNQHIAAVWDEMEADGSSIFIAKSEDGGTTWLSPIRLTKASSAATHPRLVATSHGYLALWTEKPNKQPSHLAWQVVE